MGNYNQFHPTVLGMEFPPLVKGAVLLDTATEVGYRWTPQQASTNYALARVLTTQPPPGQALRKCISVNVYTHYEAPSTGQVRKITIPVASGSLGTGASNVGGATVADCVKNPSDTNYTLLSGANAYVRLWFDVNATRVARALQQMRILDVTVRYAVTGPFDTLPNGLVLALERPSATVVFDMDNALTGPVNNYDNTVPRRSRLGDLNPFWSTAFTPDSNYERAPWHYNSGTNNHVGLTQLAASGGSNVNVRFTTSADAAGTEWRIQYAALEVTYCNEDRTGGGGLEITTGATIRNDMFCYDVPIGSVFSSYGGDAFAAQGVFYDLTVAQGYCGALSVAYPVPFSLDRISMGEVYEPHEGIIIRRSLREGEVWTRETTDWFPAVALYTSSSVVDASTIIAGTQTYIDQLVAPTSQLVFSDEYQARIVDDVTAGTEYDYVRFYARVQPATAAELEVYQVDGSGTTLGPYASITVAQFLELPELNDGWRQVTLAWDTPVVATGAGLINIYFHSFAETGAPWDVLGADANPFDIATQDIAVPTYGGTTAVARVDDNDDVTADLTVMLIQAMPAITGLTVGTATQALSLVDESCDLPVCGIPTGITYVTTEWDTDNSPAVAGFAYYEVQRRDTTMTADVWETVATVSDVSQGTFADYEARIGVQSSYRVRFVHVDGYTGAWSSTADVTIAAPGVTGHRVDGSVLVLTTNHNPSANLAHVMQWDGAGVPAQEFTFVEAGGLVLQEMYERDYRVAFKPLERGGVEFSRTLLVNALGVPSRTLSDGFSGLRDLAWDTVPYVCVRDEQSNRWLTAVAVPSGTVRDVPNAGHLMLAQANFAEVTATPAPIDYTADCEGLTLYAGDNQDGFTTLVGDNALQGTLSAQDTFTRVVAAGSWGSADTGETYTLSSAANSSVNGTHGVLTATAANAGLNARMSGNRDYVRVQTQVKLPALATGAPYRVGLITHAQDQVALTDDFNRTTSPGWGSATTGQAYSQSDPSLFSTTGTRGRINLSSTGRKMSSINYGRNAYDVTVGRIGLNAAPTGGGGVVTAYIEMGRNSAGTTRASLKIMWPTSGTITYQVVMVENSVETAASAIANSGLANTTAIAARFRMNGYRAQAKVWTSGTAEPGTLGVDEDMDTPVTINTRFALGAEKNSSVTNATMQVEFDDMAVNISDGFDCYRVDLICNTDGTMDGAIVSRFGNFDKTLATNDVSGTYTANTVVNVDVISNGWAIDARLWPVGQPEPPHDGIEDGSLVHDEMPGMPDTGGGRVGVRLFRDTSNSNTNPAAQWDYIDVLQLPKQFDVRVKIRPVADQWHVDFRWYSYNSGASEYTGELLAEFDNASVRWYSTGPEFFEISVPTSDLDIYVNQLIWVRMLYDTDNGSNAGQLRVYTSLDGSSWTLKATETTTTPAGVAPQPADGIVLVEVDTYADALWVHEVLVLADGVALYSPDFAAQPAGTIQLTDDQDNLWTGETALCAD